MAALVQCYQFGHRHTNFKCPPKSQPGEKITESLHFPGCVSCEASLPKLTFLFRRGQELYSTELLMSTAQCKIKLPRPVNKSGMHEKSPNKIKLTHQESQEKEIQREERNEMSVQSNRMIPSVFTVVFRILSLCTNSFIFTRMWFRANCECPAS